MSKQSRTLAAVGATFAISLGANAADVQNPFSLDSFSGNALTVAQGVNGTAGETDAVDMAGNKVKLRKNFDYGGDNMAKYADGKLGTGEKDPSVCGTFGGESCSMKHLK